MDIAETDCIHRGQRVISRSSFFATLDQIVIHTAGTHVPSQQHPVTVGALRCLQVLYLRRSIVIQVGTVDCFRRQVAGVNHFERRVGLIEPYLVLVMHAGAVGDIGHMDVPRSVAVDLHAVVRNRCLDHLSGLNQRTLEPQTCTVIPVTIRLAGRILRGQFHLHFGIERRADTVVIDACAPCLLDRVRQFRTTIILADQ